MVTLIDEDGREYKMYRDHILEESEGKTVEMFVLTDNGVEQVHKKIVKVLVE